MKVRSDEQSVMNSGRLFHERGPATAKTRSPSDERRVAGTDDRAMRPIDGCRENLLDSLTTVSECRVVGVFDVGVCL